MASRFVICVAGPVDTQDTTLTMSVVYSPNEGFNPLCVSTTHTSIEKFATFQKASCEMKKHHVKYFQ